MPNPLSVTHRTLSLIVTPGVTHHQDSRHKPADLHQLQPTTSGDPLQPGSDALYTRIVAVLRGRLVDLACHKYASNVAEQCTRMLATHRATVMAELFADADLPTLLQDR